MTWQVVVVAIFGALLDWATAFVKEQTHVVGTDVAPKPGLREHLNRRLAEWKARRGVP